MKQMVCIQELQRVFTSQQEREKINTPPRDENKGRGKQLLEDLRLAGRRVHEETLALVTSKKSGQICEGAKYENAEEYSQNRSEKTLPDVTLSNISYKLAMCKPFDPMTLCAGIYSKDTLSYCDIHRALGRQCTRGWAQALSAPCSTWGIQVSWSRASAWFSLSPHTHPPHRGPYLPFSNKSGKLSIYSSTPDSGWLEPSPSGLSSLPGSH